jgi:hypothetical protein
MRYTLYIIVVVLLAAYSCTKNDNSKKIKEAITGYLTTGMDKKDVRVTDSIGIISIDTLTQKNSLKITLDRYYNMLKGLNGIYDAKLTLIKADSALLSIQQQQKALYEKHGEKYDDASLKEQVVKMNTDTTELNQNLQDIQKTKNAIDSFDKCYANADSVSFFEYFVNAKAYFKDGSIEQGSFIISKDWKVRR